jgi:tetratricopeptide (TPR) repeat protein
MLFDLRGRGRRRTVQAIYLSLALLMGGGLVLFGVGGTGIGLLNQNDNGGGGGSTNFSKQVKAAQKYASAHPQSPNAWAALARKQYQNANADYDSNSGTYTKDALPKLRAAARSWDRYVALNPKNPDVALARYMTTVFATLNKPEEAVKAWELVIDGEPSQSSYANLAVAAYAAKQTAKGDAAAAEAVRRAPKDQRQQLKAQLKSAKTQALAQAAQGASTATTP